MLFLIATTLEGLPISELGSMGLAGYLCWHLITKTLPQKDRQHREERAEDRAEHLKHLKQRDDKMNEILDRYHNLLEKKNVDE